MLLQKLYLNSIDGNDIFKDNPSGVIPISSIGETLKEKVVILILLKKNKKETEAYGIFYKTTVSKALRDRFGAKNPKTRSSKQRSLSFDIEETFSSIRFEKYYM